MNAPHPVLEAIRICEQVTAEVRAKTEETEERERTRALAKLTAGGRHG